MMSRQNQFHIAGIVAAFLIVILMIGAYAVGTFSNRDVLAAQVTATAEPHAGHGAPPAKATEAAESTEAIESETSAAFTDLVDEWETMQEDRLLGMVHPTDEHIEHVTSMLVRMQQVMQDASPSARQGMHGRMTGIMQGMMPMVGEIMGEIEAMPAGERAPHMAAAMAMMEEMTAMMGMMSAPAASGAETHQSHSPSTSGTMPAHRADTGAMMSMDTMQGMMSMMGDMEGMMSRMKKMMGELHGSMPMDKMGGMMERMDGMMSMMGEMKGMMDGMMGGMNGMMDAGSSAADAPAQADLPHPDQADLMQSAEAGAVTVKVTPLNLYGEAAATLDFTVVLETHTVDLPADLSTLAVLRAGDREVAAVAWTTPATGHHIEGRLSFPAVDEAGANLLSGAHSVSLVINNLAEIEERIFTWSLDDADDSAHTAPAADPHAGHGAPEPDATQHEAEVDPHAGHGTAPEETEAAPAVDHSQPGGHAAHGGPIPSQNVPAALQNVGGQPLAYTEEDGVKVFELSAQPVRWTIIDGDEPVTVTAWSYNGTVPGPMIRVTEGDQVRVVLTNNLPEATSIHWHGIPVPYEMDGMTPVAPGESFVYEFTAPPAGSFMYHSHISSDKQVTVGLYAPLIVDPIEADVDAPDVDVMWMLSEWRVVEGQTFPAMPMAGGEPNYFTINGKAYPSTEKIVVKKGDTVRVRIAAIGQFAHPMHLHGMNFRIVAYDGVSLTPEQQIVRNTVPVQPGEVVDIEFTADNVGTWMFHCHILHHVTNDGMEPGGLLAIVEVIE